MSLVTSIGQGIFPGMKNTMLEPEVNKMATDFVINHYEDLVTAARKMCVAADMCNDIVHDVYVSLLKSEQNGEGYNPNKGNVGLYISLEEFVYGRLKKYSLNKKYRVQNGKNDVKEYEQILKGNKSAIMEIPSSCQTEDIEDMAFYQKAYVSAASYDDLESIEIELSVEEELEYCLTFESTLNMNLRFFLKNLSKIARMDIDTSVFSELKKLGQNREFAEAIRTILDFAKANPEKYQALVLSI